MQHRWRHYLQESFLRQSSAASPRAGNGRVTLKLKHRLRHGHYAIRVTAVDRAGNLSVTTAPRATI